MTSQPGTRRLQSIDEQSITVAAELEAIHQDESPQTTRVSNGDVFDHRAWLRAELADVVEERGHLLDVVDSDGEVDYTRDYQSP